MAERVRQVSLRVEVDTNKRTVGYTFLDRDYDDLDELFEAARGWLDDLLESEPSPLYPATVIATFTGHPSFVPTPMLIWLEGHEPPLVMEAVATPPGGVARVVRWRRVGAGPEYRCESVQAVTR